MLGLVAGFGYWLGNRAEQPELPIPRFGPDCTVEADGQVELDHEQLANAATITAVGVRLDMPDRAVVVALATAMQESKLRNLPHLGGGNDHDSVGLFQQRPSQGWGTEEEVGDPRYASERFYLALRDVAGWEDMRVTDAAQRVQRSAYPEAYERWSPDASVLATAFLGQASGAVSCRAPDDPPLSGEEAAAALGAQLAQDWGDQTPVAIADPPGVTVTAGDNGAGWRYAHWLVSRAASHGVTRVQFADLEWTATQNSWSSAASAIDHVLAEVADSR
jgi:hypothetical protein